MVKIASDVVVTNINTDDLVTGWYPTEQHIFGTSGYSVKRRKNQVLIYRSTEYKSGKTSSTYLVAGGRIGSRVVTLEADIQFFNKDGAELFGKKVRITKRVARKCSRSDVPKYI